MKSLFVILAALFCAVSSFGQFTNVTVGTSANDGTGDPLRTAFQKLNFADNWLKTNLAASSNLANYKVAITNGTANGLTLVGPTTNSTLTASRAMILDSGGRQTNSVTTDTEIAYLSGVTGGVQTNLNAKLSATNGVSVGLTNTATGSTTARGIDDRWADVKNVLDYGAVDGADSTLAIRAAITAAGTNGTLIFPSGRTFLLSGSLTPLEGQTWVMYGAKLKRANEVTATFATAITTGAPRTITVATNGFYVGADVTVFSGSSFDISTHRITAMTATTVTMGTAFTTAFPSGGTLVSAFSPIFTTAARVKLLGGEIDGNQSNNASLQKWQLHNEVVLISDSGLIRDMWIHDAQSEGVELGGQSPMVDGCRIEDTQGNGIHISASSGATIQNTVVLRMNKAGTAPGHADGAIIASNSVGDTRILNCYIDGGGTGISGIGSFDSADNSSLLVSGCTITNFGTYAIEANLPDVNVSEYTITQNKFYNAGTVWFGNNSADPASTNGVKNIIYNNNLHVDTTLLALLVKGLTGSGNIFTNSLRSNIVVQLNGVKDVSLVNTDIEGGGYGIYVTSNGSGTNVENVQILGGTLRNQWFVGLDLFRTGMVNVAARGVGIVAKTNLVHSSWTGAYVSDGSVLQGCSIFAEDGTYGVLAGSGASGIGARIIGNHVTTRSGMSTIQLQAGSSNSYVSANFVSSAIGEGGSTGNFIGFNPILGEPLRTGTGVLMGSVSANATNLMAWNRLSIIDPADTGATNHTVTAAGGSMVLTSAGLVKLITGSGGMLINAIPGSGASYLTFTDGTNSVQIRANLGNLSFAPANGGYYQVMSYGGNPYFQIGGTLGDTFFKGASLSANTITYLDANRQFKSLSTVSDTEAGYLDGVTSAIQTQLDAKLTSANISDTAFASSWNGVTTIAPSKNAAYDWAHTFDTDDDGLPDKVDLSSAGLVKTDSGGVLSVAAEGTDYSSPGSTNTFTNKTFDAAGTGNVLKFTDYVDFVYPSRVDGSGATIVTNDYTSGLWGLATYSGSADTNGNYAIFRIGAVPNDLDTSVAMTLKNLAIRVAGTDADAAEFTIGLWSPASSSGYSPSDFTALGTFINFDSGTLSSPAANDIFYFSDVTLTGWASAVTAGRPFIIGIARRNGNNDDAITIVSGSIAYGRTQ